MREEAPTIEQARHAYCDGLSGTSRTRAESGAEFDRMIAAVQREAAARALTEAANAWQINGWAHDLPEKGAERPQIILHMAQAATEMLRTRAAEIREGKNE